MDKVVEGNKAIAPGKQSPEAQKTPDGSQDKAGSSDDGNIVGLKKQLGREKDKTKGLEESMTELKSEIASLRDSASNSEESHPDWVEKNAKKELASLQRKLQDSEGAKQTAERQIEVLKISAEYGIPAEVLTDVKSDKDLALKVLQWQKDKVAEAEGKSSGKFETGSGAPAGEPTSEKILAMTDKEFAEHVTKLRTESLKRK